MIRVNLARGRKQVTKSEFGVDFRGVDLGEAAEQKQALVRILMMLILPAGIYAYYDYTLPEKQAAIQQTKQQIETVSQYNAKVATSVEEIKKLKTQLEEVEKKTNAIEKLSSDRLTAVQTLDYIQQNMPEKMWLTHVEFSVDKFIIAGLSSSDIEITNFMESLQKYPMVSDLELIRSSEQSTNMGLLKKFELSFVVDNDNIAKNKTSEADVKAVKPKGDLK